MMNAELNQRSGNCGTFSTMPPPAMYSLYSRALSRERLELRAVERDGLLHESIDAVLALAGRGNALQEILGEHHESRRQLPVIADAEVDHLQRAVEVALDAGAVLRDVHVRLHDEGGVLFDLLAHRCLQGNSVEIQKSAGLMPMSSSMTRAVMVPMAEMPPPGWQCGPVM